MSTSLGRLRHGRRLLAALILLGAATALLAFRGRAGARPNPSTFEVTETDLRGRMRIGGAPGDAGLRNEAVTAVVRRRDGVLVDFWQNGLALPSTRQLGDTANVDGLWRFNQALVYGGRSYLIEATDVVSDEESIRARAEVAIGPSRYAVTTRYTLASATAARIHIETTIEHAVGQYTTEVILADTLKWGNVTPYGPGPRPLPVQFDDRVEWIGRKGAGGDLVLEAAPGQELHVGLGGTTPAFWPPIYTEEKSGKLKPGDRFTVARSLVYRDIPVTASTTEEGRLEVTITDEAGRPLPSKLSFRGRKGTPDPDFGDQGGASGAGRFAWSGTGIFERRLPVGHYEVMATAGPERDAARFEIAVEPETTISEARTLPRVLETPGWIAADLHLHQVASVDADISFANRVISVAAEGVELAVATDHYAITDLGPTVRTLMRRGLLARPVASVSGSEISTTGNRFGHFNAFPLPLGADIPYHDTTPHEIFKAVRKEAPEAILQVNHPRWNGIGYFQALELDKYTGDVPDEHAHMWNADFDAIEVYNGVDVTNEASVLTPLFDWLNLLGNGHRYTATGSSDSHKLFFLDPGLPRTLIRWGEAKSDDDDVRAADKHVIEALRQGRAIVTSGPIIDIDVAGAGPGQTARVDGSEARVHIRVRAAPWVDASRLRVFSGPGRAPAVDRAIPPSDALTRLDETFPITVAEGSFVVALVTGQRPLENVYSANARPMAFTNPVWVRKGQD